MDNSTDVLLVDTYGEALKFYMISNCVFVGGSLVKHGGQNPIEPSRLGCKIFHGPNVSNFVEIYEYLKSLGVTYKISSSEELSQALVEELKEDKVINDGIIQKIESFGQNTLDNVIKELKKYI